MWSAEATSFRQAIRGSHDSFSADLAGITDQIALAADSSAKRISDLLAGRSHRDVRAILRGFDLYGVIVALYYIRNALPLAALFYAVSLSADEVEDKTLTYLFTRPITRASILIGKFAAYMATLQIFAAGLLADLLRHRGKLR